MTWPISSNVSSADNILATQYNNLRADALDPWIIEQGCTSNTTIDSDSETDITGASISITPSYPTWVVVWATFSYYVETLSDGSVFECLCAVDGAVETARCSFSAAEHWGTVNQIWVFPLSAAAHTVKLQARRGLGTVSATLCAFSTKLVLWAFLGANVTGDPYS